MTINQGYPVLVRNKADHFISPHKITMTVPLRLLNVFRLPSSNSLSKDRPRPKYFSVVTWHTESSHLALGPFMQLCFHWPSESFT